MPQDDLKRSIDALRKRMTDDFRKEKANLEHVFEDAPEAIVVMDVEGRILQVNREFAEMFGYTRDEVNDKSLDDLITPDKLKRQAQWTAERAKDGKKTIVETIRNRKDGSMIHVSLIAAPIVLDGKHISTYTILRDISRRRRMEDELRREKAYLEQLFQNAMEGIVMADIEGRVVHVNGEFTRMFGYPAGEAVGRTVDELLVPEEAMEDACQITKGVSLGNRVASEAVRKRKDGTRIHVSLLASPIIVDGVQVGVYGIYRDITSRVRFQEQIRTAQKLESLGILAGGIAHDFNNILMAILGNTELALMKLPDPSPVRDNISAVVKAAKSAAHLCRQMLAYSGKGKFQVQVLNISDVVEQLGNMLEICISKKADLHYELAENLPGIDADSAQIAQVVMNLIVNASEALEDEPGQISLRTGLQDWDQVFFEESLGDEELAEGPYVFLEVTDTGSGMDEETVSRLFDPFFTTKFTGRGLGLSAVLGIMRSHRGAIKVDSVPGKGTTFQLYFPASKRKPRPRETEAIDLRGTPWKPGTKVLIVDDEESVRLVGESILFELGFDVLSAVDGVDAVEVFGKHGETIACVLLDLTMPRMDGGACLEKLREIDPGVQVILTSGYSESEVTERFAGKGLTGFIQKPFQIASLQKKLEEVLSSG